MTKYIEVATIRPSFALAKSYENELTELVDFMLTEVIIAIKKEYKQTAIVAMDSINISQILKDRIAILFKRWDDIFNSNAGIFANKFITAVDEHNARQLQNGVKKVLNYKDNKILNKLAQSIIINPNSQDKLIIQTKNSLIQEQINLITDISQEVKTKISTAVFDNIGRNRSFKELQHELIDIKDINKTRARLIAKNQIDYATSVINNARATNLGFTHSKWRHSTASKIPRQSHLHANGKIYETAKGCFIDGEYIIPAEKINCNCYSVVVIELND